MTPRGVHRAGGVLIYFTALSVLYPVSGKILARIQTSDNKNKSPCNRPKRYFKAGAHSMAPLFWYCAVTLGIPLLNIKSNLNLKFVACRNRNEMSAAFIVAVPYRITRRNIKSVDDAVSRSIYSKTDAIFLFPVGEIQYHVARVELYFSKFIIIS